LETHSNSLIKEILLQNIRFWRSMWKCTFRKDTPSIS